MKKFAIALVFVLAISGAAFATESRVMVMGDNGTVLVDDANTFRYFGRVYNYPDIAVGEFEVPDGDEDALYGFGINWQFNEDNPCVLGTYFSTDDPVLPMTYLGQNLPVDWLIDELQNRRVTLLYGRQLFGENFGFLFNYTSAGTESDAAGDLSKQSFSRVVFGVGITEAESGKWDVAASVGFGSWTEKDDEGYELSEPDGFFDMTVEGRYFLKRSDKVTLVPHLGFWFGSRGATYIDGDAYSEDLFQIDAGVGMQYHVSPNVLGVLDFGLRYIDVTTDETILDTSYETSSSMFALPYLKAGIEGQVFKWMDVRMGAVSQWEAYEESDIVSVNFADNSTYLGFGFHWGNLHIDTYTEPQMFLDGFNFISGAENNMNFQISVLYEMK